MTKKYNFLVFIGRFQPFHAGHQHVLEKALSLSDNVIVLVGSSNVHRSVENPWSFEEREGMIKNALVHKLSAYQELVIKPLEDFHNDTAWVMSVQDIVDKVANEWETHNTKIGLIGYDKDSTSYYLKMFPTWDVVEIDTQYGTINATQIREQYFQDAPIISEFLPDTVRSFLREFALGDTFKWVLKEYKYIRDYKKIWENAPFPPTFVTVDPVVVQSGNILLVTRKEPPYAGSLALPGGFLNVNETLENAVVRELKEETRIRDNKGEIPPAMLKSFITKREVFDNPNRSKRGRTITHAFLFDLPKKDDLYMVKGDDDAEHAAWYSLAELKNEDFMEDHAFIIQKMLEIKF